MNRLIEIRGRRTRHPAIAGRILSAIAVSLLLFAGLAEADWLVTLDGKEIEIDGSWEERGALLVFTLTDGTLASMKKSEVDLDESLRVTEAAREEADSAADASPSPPQKAVFVLTDADVSHVRSPAGSSEESAAGEEGGASVPSPEPVQVRSWRQADLPGGDGLLLTGSARNASQDTVADLTLEVVVLDYDGGVQATAPATLGATVLAPGQSCTLSSDLIGVFDIPSVRFRFGFTPVRTEAAPMAAQSTQRPEPE